MKRILLSIFIILPILYFSSCEKDDICVEGDTPLLVIGFFDVNDTTTAKAVPSLRIGETSTNLVISTFSDRSNSDSIAIPLLLNAASTEFVFITNSRDDENNNEAGNLDTLTFNYTVREKFVSRACGFVGTFNGLDTTRTVFSSDWIKRITIVEPNVEFSDAIHVKIFH